MHNVASAFTYNIVSERYRVLEKEKPLDSKVNPEKTGLLDKSMKTEVELANEGGEDEEMMFGRPQSREVSMLEIERRNAGGSNRKETIPTSSRAMFTDRGDGMEEASYDHLLPPMTATTKGGKKAVQSTFGTKKGATQTKKGEPTKKEMTMDEKARQSMSKLSKLEDNLYELDTDQDYQDRYGDVEMLEHEAKADTNFKTYIAMILVMIVVVLSAATCGYMLVFYFSGMLALYCLIMWVVGFILVDVLVA